MEHPFESGPTPDGLIQKLEGIVQLRTDFFDAHVNVVRGIHACEFCGKEVKLIANCKEVLLGMSEIWLPDDSGWLASPSLIVHYITDHGYLPPPIFVQAVRELNLGDHFLGQEVCDQLVGEKTVG